MMIPAIRLLVVRTLNAPMDFARVCLNIKAIRTADVDQSVSLTMTVLETRLASETSASILALELAVKMPSVM